MGCASAKDDGRLPYKTRVVVNTKNGKYVNHLGRIESGTPSKTSSRVSMDVTKIYLDVEFTEMKAVSRKEEYALDCQKRYNDRRMTKSPRAYGYSDVPDRMITSMNPVYKTVIQRKKNKKPGWEPKSAPVDKSKAGVDFMMERKANKKTSAKVNRSKPSFPKARAPPIRAQSRNNDSLAKARAVRAEAEPVQPQSVMESFWVKLGYATTEPPQIIPSVHIDDDDDEEDFDSKDVQLNARKRTLPKFESALHEMFRAENMEDLLSELLGIGISSVDDLQYVTEADLSSINVHDFRKRKFLRLQTRLLSERNWDQHDDMPPAYSPPAYSEI